jgi:hypothetical protein
MRFALDGRLSPAGYVQITDLSSATSLTVPEGNLLTLIQAEGEGIRYRDDGTDPTSSVGMLIDAGQTLVYNGDPKKLRLIAATLGAIANISYYRS